MTSNIATDNGNAHVVGMSACSDPSTLTLSAMSVPPSSIGVLNHESQETLSAIFSHAPEPVASSKSSRSQSFYGTTACTTPSHWSFVEKAKVEVNVDTSLLRTTSPCSTTFDVCYDENAYLVQKLHKYDNIDLLPRWKQIVSRFSPLTTICSLGSYVIYFAFRIYCTRDSMITYHKAFWLAWFFIAAEALVALPAFFHQAWLILSAKGRSRAKLRLSGPFVPTVDVFITCCHEDIDVILDTARAACGVDYPQDRFRVLVLDDGGDQALKKAIEEMQNDHYPNLIYHAREKTKPHHAKAGNLIGGTDHVTKLEGGAGEYIAALDADMIVEPDWLRAIVAHCVNDAKMALACPPQLFYNIPHNDPLAQSLDAFVHVVEPSKDATGVAWCTGSGYLIRRSALEAIGGWPLGSLAEDVCTSSLLLGAGWKTAYVHEGLQYGQVPDSFVGHLKQRTRWTLGTLQTAFKLRWFMWGKDIKQMTFFQRLSGLVFSMDALFKMFLLISMVTIPVVLCAGGTLVAYTTIDQLRWQIRLCTISLLLTLVNLVITYMPSGYRLGRQEGAATIWMAPYHALTVIRSFVLPTWLGGKAMSFAPSGSIKNELNERDAFARAPLHRRLKVILWDCRAGFHVLFVAFVLIAVIRSCVLAFREHDKWAKLTYLLTHACWPPMLWVPMVNSCLTPLRYAISPPTIPDREELLDRDPKTGIAHPKKVWKDQRWTPSNHFHEIIYSLATVYTCILFIGTFVWPFILKRQNLQEG